MSVFLLQLPRNRGVKVNPKRIHCCKTDAQLTRLDSRTTHRRQDREREREDTKQRPVLMRYCDRDVRGSNARRLVYRKEGSKKKLNLLFLISFFFFYFFHSSFLPSFAFICNSSVIPTPLNLYSPTFDSFARLPSL